MQAYLYETVENKKVKCNLCHHRCLIKNGKTGICCVRYNQEGILKSLVYGKLIASHVDPVEKKPVFHLLPGSLSYSIATAGCNFKCLFCQNSEIAQMPSDNNGLILGDYYKPEDIVNNALSAGCKSISYTYTEPTVYFEFAYDVAKLAHKKGLKNIFVTNGYMTLQALEMIAPYLDAANVDLKAFNDNFYKKYCSAKIEHVKQTLKAMKSLDILVEVTTLIIPGLNDDTKELEKLAGFLLNSLGENTPWHISRFHPTYRLKDRPQTPVKTLVKARETGLKTGLKYVYTGNIPGDEGENTFCQKCGKILISRWGFTVRKNLIENSQCPYCSAGVEGIILK